MFDKPRWLVLNKLDMVPAEERVSRVVSFIKRFGWKGPVFEISALTREGCEQLVQSIYQHVAAMQQHYVEPDVRFDDGADDAAAADTQAQPHLDEPMADEPPAKPARQTAARKAASRKKAKAVAEPEETPDNEPGLDLSDDPRFRPID